jgi:hypothetical protein
LQAAKCLGAGPRAFRVGRCCILLGGGSEMAQREECSEGRGVQ